ncbi:MAG: hypothetical protein N2487_00605 [Verrucomicrobiae bacterium]|nr:hypothetical protein [Verrucomicrobiae bacterium]
MNSNSDSKQIRISSRHIIIGAVVILLGLAVVFAFSGPKPSWMVKFQVKSYLKKNSGKSDFSTNFKFPSKAEMAKAPEKKNLPDEKNWRGSATKKDFYTLRNEYIKLKIEAFSIEEVINKSKMLVRIAAERISGKKDDPVLVLAYSENPTNGIPLPQETEALKEKVKALENEIADKEKQLAEKEEQIKPILADLIEYQLAFKDLYKSLDDSDNSELAIAQNEFVMSLRQKFDEATTYAKMYEYIGQELWVVDKLFESKNPAHLRVALRMARQAARDAMDLAQNQWLGARIYEAYILPNVGLAGGDTGGGGNRRNRFSMEGLLNECASIFQMAEEQENEIRTYRMMLSLAPDSPRADFTRLQLASIYDNNGDTGKAEKYVKQVQNTNNINFVMRRFPNLQKYLTSK